MQSLALDLKVARRKAGLSQRDCAHLLGVHNSRISLIESGQALPKVADLFLLSIIYGKAMEIFFSDVLEEAFGSLRERLATLPRGRHHALNRHITLSDLAERLDTSTSRYGSAH